MLSLHSASWTKNVSLASFSILLIALFVLPSFQTPIVAASGSNAATILSPLRALAKHPIPNRIPPTGKVFQSVSGKMASSPPPVNWDEQLGLTISQDSASLSYNVSAVAQSDSDGYGPGYLLNGLTDTGNWYQVGLAYDWPVDGGGYASGFSFLYESFNSSGVSVFPANGGGGLLNYSKVINEGDEVLLSLNFSGSQVVMFSRDWNTGATASENYSSKGGSIFLGLQTANNANGFFSGLMTEQYHAQPYFGQEAAVMYTNPYVGLNSGTMWIDEYNPNTNQTLFGGSTADLPYSNPNQLLYYSLNGTSEASDAYEFMTGSKVLVPVTLSYSILGGGLGYKAPELTFTSDGSPENITLTTFPTRFLMDQGSTWTVGSLLNGSTSDERWISLQSNGTVSQPVTLKIVYMNEFYISFGATPSGGGTVSPSVSAWYEASSPINLTATPKSPFLFSNWVANSTSIHFANFTSASTFATINGAGSITGKFSLLALSLSSYSESVIDGSSISDVAKIVGNNETVTLSISGLPSGATAAWTNSRVTIGVSTVSDSFNVSTSFSTPPGTYTVTVTAVSGNTSDFVQFSLKVMQADPITVSFSTSDGSAPSAPTLTYVYNGINKQILLTTTPQVIYVDNGSMWSAPSSLNVSSSQRWIAGAATEGTTAGQATIEILYYHQFLVSFTFGSINNKTSTLNIPNPSVSFTSAGHSTQVQANESEVWADSGTTYNYPSAIAVSSSYRWELAGNQTGVVSKSMTPDSQYTPQFLVSASYGLAEPATSGIVSEPKLSLTGNGTQIILPLSETGANYWINSGSSWSASSNLSSSAVERWLGSSLSGTVNSSAPIKPEYAPQFLVTIRQNVPIAGSVSGRNGWYNANSSISISALANTGWRFEMWTGATGTLNQSSTDLLVTSPLNETAVFFSSLVIAPASNGHIAFSFGSNSGTVAGGTSTILYVPPNTNVSLSASSDSAFYSPGSWSVGNGSSSSSSSFILSVQSPTSVSISFTLNLTTIALIGLVLAGLLGSVVFVLLRRSGGRDMGGGASHTWKW